MRRRTRGLYVAGRRLLRGPAVRLLLRRRPATAAGRIEGHRRCRRIWHGLRTRGRRRLRGSCRRLGLLRRQGGLRGRLLLGLRRQRLLRRWRPARRCPHGEGRLILRDGRRLRRVRQRRRAGRRQRLLRSAHADRHVDASYLAVEVLKWQTKHTTHRPRTAALRRWVHQKIRSRCVFKENALIRLQHVLKSIVCMPGEGRRGRLPSLAQPQAGAAARAGSPSAPVCPNLQRVAAFQAVRTGTREGERNGRRGVARGAANQRHRTSEHDVVVGLGLGRDVLRRLPVLCAVRLDCKAQQRQQRASTVVIER